MVTFILWVQTMIVSSLSPFSCMFPPFNHQTDVIDTTGLDTNIADIRHSAYNLNPSLLRDLEELVSTGKRAMDRSLLYREGNMFSYCNAPSFVSM